MISELTLLIVAGAVIYENIDEIKYFFTNIMHVLKEGIFMS